MIIAMIVCMMFSLSALAVAVVYAAKQERMLDEARETVKTFRREISNDKMSETEAHWRARRSIDDQIEATNKELYALRARVNEYIKGRVIQEGAQVSLKHNSFGMWDIVSVEESEDE